MTAATPIAPLPRQRLEEAADWWALIQDAEATPEDITAWLEWLESNPDNRDAYQRIQELTLRLAVTQRTTIHAAARRSRGRAVRLAAAAAAGALVIGAALWMQTHPGLSRPTLTLSTPVAALEQVPLPDGSRVSLGGATDVEALYTETARAVRLKEGEAYFEVRHEANQRPFIVNAGTVSIRAVGTAFNVRNTHGRVAVTVTEGKVRATRFNVEDSAVDLRAGEQGIYDPRTDQFSVATVDAQRTLSWRDRRLEFVDEPLDSVIVNVNRYSPRRIEVRNVDLRHHSYTGTFQADTLDEWLIAVERAFPIRIRSAGDTVVIESRAH